MRVNVSSSALGDVVWFSHGTVKSPLRQAAELKGLLHGLQKAHENGIEDLLMCTRFELLTQVWSVNTAIACGCNVSDCRDAGFAVAK